MGELGMNSQPLVGPVSPGIGAVAEFLRNLGDDGLYLPLIKPHSFEKIRRHDYYAELFASGMKKKWAQRAYVGLYSGAGRARVASTGEIVETTAMSAIRLPVPFTKYVFVDNDERCTQALRARITALEEPPDCEVLEGDVADVAPLVRHALPPFDSSRGLLSFCFVDPFAADLQFSVIRELSDYRMDFLILLMLGWDARVNFRRYFEDQTSTRIAELIDCPDWREQYARAQDRNVIRFLLSKFDDAMVRLGYLAASHGDYHRVTVVGKNVLQYILVLYTRHELGQTFWRETLRRTSLQIELGLG